MRPPISRVGPARRPVPLGLSVLNSVTISAVRTHAASYPNPGVVTGAITGLHDAPTIHSRPV